MSATSSRMVDLDGMRIHYVTWGTPGHPPIVLQHGLRAYGEWFEALGSALADRYFVIAPDLRGRNLSDWASDGDYTIAAYVRDLLGLAKALGLSRFALAGHSLGGAIAAAFTAQYPEPVAATVIYDWSPQPMPAGTQRIVSEVKRTPAEFRSRQAAMDFLKELHPTSPDDLLQTRLRCTLKDLPGGGMSWRIDRACTQMSMMDPPEKSWANFAKVSCPALIVRGLKSDILSAEAHAQILRTVSNGVSADIEDAAHMLFEDNPAATVRATETFLRSAYPA